MYQNKDIQPIISPKEEEILQALSDIPIVEHPLSHIGKMVNESPGELMKIISNLRNRKIIRRIAPVLAHRKIGFRYNAMVLFKSGGNSLVQLARELSEMKETSHVFRRDNRFGYNLYAMIHATNQEELNEIIHRISSLTDAPMLIAETDSEIKKKSLSVLRRK